MREVGRVIGHFDSKLEYERGKNESLNFGDEGLDYPRLDKHYPVAR